MMNSELKIESTEDTPLVIFDKNSGKLMLSGRSLPEDAFGFYIPVMEWLLEYSKSPAGQTSFTFNLEYFNTASAKQIYKIAGLLAALSKNNNVDIKWHYDDGDKDMYSSGERFSKLSGVAFELIKN
jgi:hypothetical protein